jgi:hypothetical protein
LRFCTRLSETSIDEKFIYALTLHRTGGILILLIAARHVLGTSRHRARRIQAKLACAIVAKPDKNVRRIGPKERGDFRRHPDRVVHTESLQSLDVKRSIVEIAGRAFFPVDTLSLAKRLPSHDESPYFLAPHRAKYRSVNKMSG